MGFFDFLKEGPNEGLSGPSAPRPPTSGLHLPPGCHIPDWRQYKVENCPELADVQKRLAARGLKDPWLRNEVWRYDHKTWGSLRWVRWRLGTFGFKYAFVFLAITIALEETVFKKKDDHKSHDSHH